MPRNKGQERNLAAEAARPPTVFWYSLVPCPYSSWNIRRIVKLGDVVGGRRDAVRAELSIIACTPEDKWLAHRMLAGSINRAIAVGRWRGSRRIIIAEH